MFQNKMHNIVNTSCSRRVHQDLRISSAKVEINGKHTVFVRIFYRHQFLYAKAIYVIQNKNLISK